jgi:hypothetical protein
MIFNVKAMNSAKFFFKCVLLGIIAIAAIGFVTMSLWNWLVPQLFNGPVISFVQTLGLLLLSKILFSGFGGKRHSHSGPGGNWKTRFNNKLSSLNPEDRERFKNKMREKWCSRDRNTSAANSDTSNV